MESWKIVSGCFFDRFISVFSEIPLKYNKAQFAKILGVKRAAITRWCRGDDPKKDSKHALYAFMDQHGVTIEAQRWIMDNYGKKPSKVFMDAGGNAAGGSI